MTQEKIRAEVRRLAAAVLKTPVPEQGDVRREATTAWDSLKHVDLMFAIEDEFSVRFDQEQFAAFASLDDISEGVAQLTSQDQTAPAPETEPPPGGAPLSGTLVFHHVGCVVRSIAEAAESYRPLARSIGEIISVTSQKVKVCFVEVSAGSFVELIEEASPDSTVSRFLQSGVTFYHAGLLSSSFDRDLAELKKAGYRHLNTFHSEAFGMRRCAFLSSPISHLIEIIEQV